MHRFDFCSLSAGGEGEFLLDGETLFSPILGTHEGADNSVYSFGISAVDVEQ